MKTSVTWRRRCGTLCAWRRPEMNAAHATAPCRFNRREPTLWEEATVVPDAKERDVLGFKKKERIISRSTSTRGARVSGCRFLCSGNWRQRIWQRASSGLTPHRGRGLVLLIRAKWRRLATPRRGRLRTRFLRWTQLPRLYRPRWIASWGRLY